MKAWANLVRRVGIVAALVGASALSGCATYYDDGYYSDRYYDDGGDYYVGRSYDYYDDYGYAYGPSYYYDSVLWPTRRYYDPWYSPYWYGSYPRSSFGFSLGYRDPWFYPSPYRYGSWGWFGGSHYWDRRDRRNVNRGDWRPGRNDDPYRRGDYRPGSAADETARIANRRGADRPVGRTYSDPDRGYRNGPIDGTRGVNPIDPARMPEGEPARGNWGRSRDGGSDDRYGSRRIEQMERPGSQRFERAPSFDPAPRAEPRMEQRVERYEPRAEPRFEQRQEAPRFEQRQEAPRFDPPPVSDSGWSRGRDEDDGREPE